MNPKERRELAISEIVLIVLAVVGLSVVVWLAWARPLKSNEPVNSFASCQAAGDSVLQTSYPEVCVTKEGKRFVNPDQKVELPSASGTDTDNQTSTATRKKLTVKEWKVAFPYPDNVRSLSYHTTASSGDHQSTIITFDDVPGNCKGSSFLHRALKDQDLDGEGHTPAQLQAQLGSASVKQIGGYYYMFVRGSDGTSSDCGLDDATKQQISDIMDGFTGTKIQQLVLAP
jgi:hypothetical protein